MSTVSDAAAASSRRFVKILRGKVEWSIYWRAFIAKDGDSLRIRVLRCSLAVWFSLLFIALWTDTGRGEPIIDAQRAYSQAEHYIQIGKIEAAIGALRQAVQLAPGNTGMQRRLAWLLLDQKRPTQALPHFQNLHSQHPSDRNIALGLAITLLNLNRHHQAVTVLNDILDIYPNDTLLLKIKGEALISRPETAPKAVAVFSQLAQKEPQNVQWPRQRDKAAKLAGSYKYGQALLHLEKGNLAAALADMQEAVKLLPQAVGYRAHYGWLLLEAEQNEAAADSFAEVLRQDPDKKDAYQGLAISRMRMGDTTGALETAGQGLVRFDRDPQLLEIYGDAAASQKETQNLAVDAYREVLRHQPANTRVAMKLARSLIARGSVIEAEEILTEVLHENPAEIQAHLELAKINQRYLAYGQAADRYEQALDIDPQNAEALEGFQKSGRMLNPQLQAQAGYLEDSQDFQRRHAYLGFRYHLNRQLMLESGYGYVNYDMDNDPAKGRLRERSIDRQVLPLLFTYRPSRRLVAELGGAFNQYSPGHETGSALAALYYQLADNTGFSLSYAFHDVIDYQGGFKGPWGRLRDVFADRDGYRYWLVDPVAVWSANIMGPSSTQAVTDKIQSHDVSFWGYQNLFSRLTLSLYGSIGDYSDGNLKRSAGATISWRALDIPLLKLKYSFYYLDYSDSSVDLADLPEWSSPLYWDPSNFKSHSAGIVLEKNIAGRLKLALESDLLFTVGADSPGFLILGELTYYFTDDIASRTTAFFMNSKDPDSNVDDYKQGNLMIGLNFRF